ncbi:hypothetical protein AGABI2DRAFT_65214 [Agaricus bisporus var. bisporus H97]|uniref:hypothetical protein n=1 Tax=Agaricus bisporus var. bisporus (strain H97 / ATCC MYA-4626 / FGSC 10389) TaxID=936046 RepID=UPI00029F65A7|nr:hypothetical protein AGABI2DRAFT_65214 [Agaricus bisporus var. bisporus H97]EKV50268.1 hypothetical protein AGABI2DRAFT_65214 [Agaricus bisporus var. bisporus H97]
MEQIRATVVERLSELAVVSRDAVLSRTWAYPILGISYFATHPNLYEPVIPVLAKSLVFSVGVVVGLIFFAYAPQMILCAMFMGFLAPIGAAVMVMGEAYVLIWIIGKPMMLAKAQDRIFDQVLVMKGHEQLVARGREIRDRGPKTRLLGKEVNIDKVVDGLGREGVMRYLASLPLNLIPGVGTAMFLAYNGKKQGPGYHARYFELKGWEKAEREAFVKAREAQYTAFGGVGLVLGMVPVAGLVFQLTSTVGAALWASQLEKCSK